MLGVNDIGITNAVLLFRLVQAPTETVASAYVVPAPPGNVCDAPVTFDPPLPVEHPGSFVVHDTQPLPHRGRSA